VSVAAKRIGKGGRRGCGSVPARATQLCAPAHGERWPPRLLAYIVAVYLIFIGIIGLLGSGVLR